MKRKGGSTFRPFPAGLMPVSASAVAYTWPALGTKLLGLLTPVSAPVLGL